MPHHAAVPRERDERIRRLEALNRAALEIAGDLDLDTVLRKILRTAAALIGARYGAVGVRASDSGFETFVHIGIPPDRARRIGELPRLHGVLGMIIRDGRTVRVRDIRADPRFSYYPAHHPVFRAFLGVPIRHRGEILGELYLAGTTPGPFTVADQRLVERLALHAGIAIATVRLSDRARDVAVRDARERLLAAIARAALGDVGDARPPSLGATASLSPRERDVLRLVVDGLSNKQIAERLAVSEKTVKTHVSGVLAKLGVADRTQAAVLAVRSRLVE